MTDSGWGQFVMLLVIFYTIDKWLGTGERSVR